MRKHVSTLLSAVAGLFFGCVSLALAQGTTATIYGTVTDSTGAVVPGAQVTATHIETNVSRATNTDNDGRYSLPFLPVGTYRLEATAAGFRKFEQSGIVLEVNRQARLDAVLQLGALTETISVTGDAPLVETGNTALGLTVNNEDIVNLPLVNRDVYSLLDLTAGVDMTGEATDNFGAPMRVTLVNGSPNSGAGSVNYSLDGGSNASGLRNTGNSAPSPDAVREFRVLTNSFSAEYGRFAGGVVDVVTKSGNNQFHGSAFEFFRNERLNANRWLPGQSALQKDPLKRNQFGGTLGGPIRRDHTFFFASYSGLRQEQSIFKNDATPPTEPERAGVVSSGSAPRDPLSGDPFPTRTIPLSRFDPVAVRLLKDYLPLPNLDRGLYEVQQTRPLDTNELQLKLDHVLTSAHQLTGSYFLTKGEDVVGLMGNIKWTDRHFRWTQQNFNAGDTWIVSPSRVNLLRLTYVRNFGGRVNLPAISLGDLGSRYQIQGTPSLPQIQVSGRFNLNSAIPGPVAGSNLYQMRDTLSITTGRHSVRLGGEVQLEKVIHDTLLNNYGTFSFNSNNPRGSGNALADFLLGLPNTMNQDAPITKIDNGWYFGLFFQDDFQVNRRLTLNLGLRYDLQPSYTDTHNRKLTFVPGAQSQVVPSALPGLLFPGDPGVSRGVAPTDWNNLMPRVGLAWDPFGDRKTAIRASFGVFSGSMSANESNAAADGQPFTTRQQFNNVKSISDPYGNQPGGVSPFPYSYTPSQPRFVAPSNVHGFSLDFRLPYTYQMNFSLQRQFARDISVTAAYVNTLAHKLPLDVDVNYPVPTPTATTQNVNARRPYLPNIMADAGMTKSILNSAYHGLQLTAEKRASRNFSVKGFYTFGKGLDTVNSQRSTRQTPQNFNNIRADRARTENDRTHNAVISGIWRIDYFRHAPPALRAVAGGWSLSAIASMRSGQPLTLTSGNDRNVDGNGGDRADLVGNPFLDPNRPRNQVVEKWFEPTAFAQPKQLTDGNAARNLLDSPGRKNVELGIFRDFRLTEGKRLQFRCDMSNGLNLVNLSSPGTGQNSSTFAAIRQAQPMRQVQLGLRFVY